MASQSATTSGNTSIPNQIYVKSEAGISRKVIANGDLSNINQEPQARHGSSPGGAPHLFQVSPQIQIGHPEQNWTPMPTGVHVPISQQPQFTNQSGFSPLVQGEENKEYVPKPMSSSKQRPSDKQIKSRRGAGVRITSAHQRKHSLQLSNNNSNNAYSAPHQQQQANPEGNQIYFSQASEATQQQPPVQKEPSLELVSGNSMRYSAPQLLPQMSQSLTPQMMAPMHLAQQQMGDVKQRAKSSTMNSSSQDYLSQPTPNFSAGLPQDQTASFAQAEGISNQMIGPQMQYPGFYYYVVMPHGVNGSNVLPQQQVPQQVVYQQQQQYAGRDQSSSSGFTPNGSAPQSHQWAPSQKSDFGGAQNQIEPEVEEKQQLSIIDTGLAVFPNMPVINHYFKGFSIQRPSLEEPFPVGSCSDNDPADQSNTKILNVSHIIEKDMPSDDRPKSGLFDFHLQQTPKYTSEPIDIVVKQKLINDRKMRRQKRMYEKNQQYLARMALIKQKEQDMRRTMSSMTGNQIEEEIKEENENSQTNSPQMTPRDERSRLQVAFHQRPLTQDEKDEIQKMNDDFAQEGDDEPIPTDSDYYGADHSVKELTDARTVQITEEEVDDQYPEVYTEEQRAQNPEEVHEPQQVEPKTPPKIMCESKAMQTSPEHSPPKQPSNKVTVGIQALEVSESNGKAKTKPVTPVKQFADPSEADQSAEKKDFVDMDTTVQQVQTSGLKRKATIEKSKTMGHKSEGNAIDIAMIDDQPTKTIVPHDIQYGMLFHKLDSQAVHDMKPKSLSKSHTEISGMALGSHRSNDPASPQNNLEKEEKQKQDHQSLKTMIDEIANILNNFKAINVPAQPPKEESKQPEANAALSPIPAAEPAPQVKQQPKKDLPQPEDSIAIQEQSEEITQTPSKEEIVIKPAKVKGKRQIKVSTQVKQALIQRSMNSTQKYKARAFVKQPKLRKSSSLTFGKPFRVIYHPRPFRAGKSLSPEIRRPMKSFSPQIREEPIKEQYPPADIMRTIKSAQQSSFGNRIRMKKPSMSLRYNQIRKQATMGTSSSAKMTGYSNRGMSGRLRASSKANHKELGRVVMDSKGLLLIPSEKFGQTMRIPVNQLEPGLSASLLTSSVNRRSSAHNQSYHSMKAARQSGFGENRIQSAKVLFSNPQANLQNRSEISRSADLRKKKHNRMMSQGGIPSYFSNTLRPSNSELKIGQTFGAPSRLPVPQHRSSFHSQNGLGNRPFYRNNSAGVSNSMQQLQPIGQMLQNPYFQQKSPMVAMPSPNILQNSNSVEIINPNLPSNLITSPYNKRMVNVPKTQNKKNIQPGRATRAPVPQPVAAMPPQSPMNATYQTQRVQSQMMGFDMTPKVQDPSMRMMQPQPPRYQGPPPQIQNRPIQYPPRKSGPAPQQAEMVAQPPMAAYPPTQTGPNKPAQPPRKQQLPLANPQFIHSQQQPPQPSQFSPMKANQTAFVSMEQAKASQTLRPQSSAPNLGGHAMILAPPTGRPVMAQQQQIMAPTQRTSQLMIRPFVEGRGGPSIEVGPDGTPNRHQKKQSQFFYPRIQSAQYSQVRPNMAYQAQQMPPAGGHPPLPPRQPHLYSFNSSSHLPPGSPQVMVAHPVPGSMVHQPSPSLMVDQQGRTLALPQVQQQVPGDRKFNFQALGANGQVAGDHSRKESNVSSSKKDTPAVDKQQTPNLPLGSIRSSGSKRSGGYKQLSAQRNEIVIKKEQDGDAPATDK